MEAETSVRRAAAADLARIAGLEAACFADPWSETLLAGELAHPSALVLVACRGAGPAAGYACFRHGGGEAELLRIAVDPAERGRGIARQLVAAGFDCLRDAAVSVCHLEVRPSNLPAQALYRRLGFTPYGRRRAYYRDGSDALLYYRRI
ncbi:MAG TPA: ribosomal protein S18-alanine N-acetyltransferase [Thermoanaerobaculia bacterium]|nr:ribosomal protein S18-alanine N-acetyltransferase [Thermoanaerobaculia bacterium]